MSFERFGRVSFTSQTKADAFVDYLEKEGLYATRCRVCEAVYFPPRADCSSCLNSDMAWFKIEGTGKLLSFTKANFAPTGFEEDAPYVLVVADFQNVKVFGRFQTGFPDDKLKVGMDVQVSTISLPEGRISYELVPA